MAYKMNLWVTTHQREALKRLRKLTCTSVSTYIRMGIDRIIKENKEIIEAVELKPKEEKKDAG
jgi:ribulose bisphosphate carboxylase small subunit